MEAGVRRWEMLGSIVFTWIEASSQTCFVTMILRAPKTFFSSFANAPTKLGLADKDIFSQDIELILSDPSGISTNSSSLLSDETDDKTRCGHPEVTVEDHKEHESHASAVEAVQNIIAEEVRALGDADLAGQIYSWPKKTNLKVGESSAFFTYVKSSAPTRYPPYSHLHQTDVLNDQGNLLIRGNADGYCNQDIQEYQSVGNLFPNSENANCSSKSQPPTELPVTWYSTDKALSLSGSNEHVPQMQPIFTVPIFLHGQPSPIYGFQDILHDLSRDLDIVSSPDIDA